MTYMLSAVGNTRKKERVCVEKRTPSEVKPTGMPYTKKVATSAKMA